MNTLQDVYGIVITPAPETVKKFTQILKILLKTYLSFGLSYLMLAGEALYRILTNKGFRFCSFTGSLICCFLISASIKKLQKS